MVHFSADYGTVSLDYNAVLLTVGHYGPLLTEWVNLWINDSTRAKRTWKLKNLLQFGLQMAWGNQRRVFPRDA
jgi:hypothetical protein